MASTKTAAAVTKKAPIAKKPRSHPPYAEMVKEAIMALKEKTGSSQYAIAKHIEDKQKDLPGNFKKLLLVQLKKLVAAGKLTKVKNSFKLASVEKVKKPAPEKKKAPAAKNKAKAKTVAETKPKKVVETNKVVKTKKVVKKSGPVKAVAKKPKSIKSPAKKVSVKKAKK